MGNHIKVINEIALVFFPAVHPYKTKNMRTPEMRGTERKGEKIFSFCLSFFSVLFFCSAPIKNELYEKPIQMLRKEKRGANLSLSFLRKERTSSFE